MAYGPNNANTAVNSMFGVSGGYPQECMDPSGLIRRMMLGGSAFGGGLPHGYHPN